MSSPVVSAAQSQALPATEILATVPRIRIALFAILLLVFTIAAYYPAHRDPFINFDDDLYVTQNPHVNHGLSGDAVKWSFTTYHAFNWHPLTWLVHQFDVQLFGLNPAGHHDVNILLHVIDVLLLFWILQRATGFAGRSFMVAALFALHPLNVESVAWVAELKTMLSMMFFLLALGAYRWYAKNSFEFPVSSFESEAVASRERDGLRKPSTNVKLGTRNLNLLFGRYLVVAVLFALGLMAKPQIITLPAVLLLWDYWPLRRMFASDPEAAAGTRARDVIPAQSFSWLILEKMPLGLIIAASSFITMKAQKVGRPFNWAYSVWTRGANAVVAYASYIVKAFWPTRLAIMYPHPGTSLARWQIVGSALFLLAITALVVANWRRRYLVVGWLWFLGTMVPMIGVVQVGRQAMADRYAYLPFIGLFIMICWGVSESAERLRLPAFALPSVSALVLLGAALVTHHQLGYWRDNVKLWSHTVDVTHNNSVAVYHVGDALKQKGQTMEALQWFYRAVAMNPNDAYSNIAIAFYEHENGINLPDALERYKRVVGRVDDETRAQLLVNMGYVYEKLGDPVHARESFDAAGKLRTQLEP
jgi:protein O-mannosyl-transferase